MARLDRREFLKLAAASGASALVLAQIAAAQETPAAPVPAAKTLELRELGATGRKVPRLGLGCASLATLPHDESGEKALAIVARAHALGVRYFDTSPSVADGGAEELLGKAIKAIQGVKRDELWIATKSEERRAADTRRGLEASLKRLGVEYLDSIHLLAVKDWEQSNENDTALDALKKAQEEKLVRHIGMTSNKSPLHAKKAIERFPYELVSVPVNPADPQRFGFVRQLLPFAASRKVAVVAMQLFLSGKHGQKELVSRKECLAYALAQPQVDVIVPGCGSVEAVEEAYGVAAGFVAPSDEALRDMEARAAKPKDGPDDDDADK